MRVKCVGCTHTHTHTHTHTYFFQHTHLTPHTHTHTRARPLPHLSPDRCRSFIMCWMKRPTNPKSTKREKLCSIGSPNSSAGRCWSPGSLKNVKEKCTSGVSWRYCGHGEGKECEELRWVRWVAEEVEVVDV